MLSSLAFCCAAQELGLLKDGLLGCPGALKAASAVLVASACEDHRLDALSAALQASTLQPFFPLNFNCMTEFLDWRPHVARLRTAKIGVATACQHVWSS